MNFSFNKDLGLLFIRVGIGLIFIKHGFSKIIGGQEVWASLGMSMQNLGVTFMPTFWGFLAACAEFFGGIALVTGFYVRYAALFMACVMVVAIIMHYNQGDGFQLFSHALSLFCVFAGLVISGGGGYAIKE